MKDRTLPLVVVIETTVLGLAAMGIFGFLIDRYDQVRAMAEEQVAPVEITQISIVLPTMTASTTRTPTVTATVTPTLVVALPSTTPTASRSPSPSASFTPRNTPLPASAAVKPTTAPTVVPVATLTVLSPTPRPTRAPTSSSFSALSQCDTIDDPGNYRLANDVVANGDCIKVQTSYVVLDCAGHSIRGANFTGSGVAIRKYGLLASQTPSYVEVRNCSISNFKYGIFVESGRYLAIHDNNSSNNYDDTDPITRFGIFLGAADGGGIRINYVSDSQIFGNTTVHQAIGIDVRNSANVTIRANTSSDNSAWGINFIGTRNSEASNNVTADNIRKCVWGAGTVGFGCDAGGIVLQGGSNNNLVANNNVIGRNGNGIFIKAHAQPCGDNNTITGNTITSVLYNSVELGFCTGNRVNGNSIRNGLDGIWLGFAHDTEIKNNTVVNMQNHGIISSNSHNNVVSGNQVVNSNEGLYFFSEDYDRNTFSWLPQGDYRSHDNCLCSNTFQNNGTAGIHLKDSTYNQVTNNTFQGNGRTVVVQGMGDGNNMQGNLGWVPGPVLDGALALWMRGAK
ncbi:MAG: NosD domain-containing protein [Acidobacteriota bacterium]